MKAVRLRNDRTKPQPLTRELFIQHGWKMPPGLLDRRNRDPRAVNAVIQSAWAVSDSRAAFVNALEECGMKRAKGDRAGIVCVDMFGAVHSLPKVLGMTPCATAIAATGMSYDDHINGLPHGASSYQTHYLNVCFGATSGHSSDAWKGQLVTRNGQMAYQSCHGGVIGAAALGCLG